MRAYYPDNATLASYYLEDSWVLDIEARPGVLTLTLDFVLTADHPEYAPPPPENRYCYRRGVLHFSGVASLSWSGQGFPPALDANDEIDYGNIDSLDFDENAYIIVGDFGEIKVEATRLSVSLD